ncbi:MAG: hypothetical protein DWP97_13475 [Calditrichaeota bacterium]|nr:MAG: hypothetical protein DWP97_13475 [Calditrichota bacterium]
MKSFRKFSLFTTITTYFLIFIGGFVRVSGAGLGCPDWPTCFGRWIPPTSLDQVPPDMVEHFNITLAWTEYINRLCGMTVGIFILITAVWAIMKYRSHKKILYPACAAAILTAIQGYQGSVVVSSLLEPIVITVHLILALLIVSLLIYTSAQAYFIETKDIPKKKITTKLSHFPGILWIIGLVQIMFGTQIRAALENFAREYPDLSAMEWLTKVGMVNHLHMTIGVFLAAYTIYVTLKILKHKDQITPLMQKFAGFISLIVMIQLFLGLSFMVFATLPMTQVFHLWMASIFIGMVLFLYLHIKQMENI